MPLYGTRAFGFKLEYGLPATFEVDHKVRHSKYIKSWKEAYERAQAKESEVNETISKELFVGVPEGSVRQPYHGTYILEKVKTSSKKVNLI